MRENRRGMLLVISGASGVGKGTLLKRLMQEDRSLVFSVSATTRAPRPGEQEGVDYHYVSDARFDELVAQDAFVEYANVHGNRYGTLRSEVDARREAGWNVVLDIDVQGALNVLAHEQGCVSVFILPPSMAELRRRLEGRATERPQDVERRMRDAAWEIAQRGAYQYNIVNDDVEAALQRLHLIVDAEKYSTRFYAVEVPEL